MRRVTAPRYHSCGGALRSPRLPPAESRGRRLPSLAMAAVLLLALWMRLPGLAADVLSNRDELSYVPKAVRYGGGDLNPHYFHNPPLAGYLMFGAIGADYAAARATGEVVSALEYKAVYLAEPESAFLAARLAALAAGILSIWHIGRLVGAIAGNRSETTRWCAVLAAAATALSPLHAQKSAEATNEIFAVLAMQLGVHASVLAARSPTWRRGLLAGAACGVAAGTKYTCVAAAASVAAAFLCAAELRWKDRIVRLAGAAVACVAGFLVVCPWAVLDAETFRAHVGNQAVLIDRHGGDSALLRYAASVFEEGLGPLPTVLTAVGLGLAGWIASTGRGGPRSVGAAAAAGPLALAALLLSHPTLAYGRYLLPALPCALALACAALAAWWTETSTPGRRGAALAFFAILASCVVWLGMRGVGLRAPHASRASSRSDAAVALRREVPDGAVLLTDITAPWLVDVGLRPEFDGRVRPEIAAKLRPAFRLARAYDYFQDTPSKVPGTEVRTDDFDGLRGLGAPVFAVVSDEARDTFAKLPPGDYPAARWHERVRAAGPVVHRTPEGLRGPVYSVIRIR